MINKTSKIISKGMPISHLQVHKQKSQMRNSIDRNLIIEEEDQIINSFNKKSESYDEEADFACPFNNNSNES